MCCSLLYISNLMKGKRCQFSKASKMSKKIPVLQKKANQTSSSAVAKKPRKAPYHMKFSRDTF